MTCLARETSLTSSFITFSLVLCTCFLVAETRGTGYLRYNYAQPILLSLIIINEQDAMNHHLENDTLTVLDTALSRVTAEKVYVTHK